MNQTLPTFCPGVWNGVQAKVSELLIFWRLEDPSPLQKLISDFGASPCFCLSDLSGRPCLSQLASSVCVSALSLFWVSFSWLRVVLNYVFPLLNAKAEHLPFPVKNPPTFQLLALYMMHTGSPKLNALLLFTVFVLSQPRNGLLTALSQRGGAVEFYVQSKVHVWTFILDLFPWRRYANVRLVMSSHIRSLPLTPICKCSVGYVILRCLCYLSQMLKCDRM
jgi:hypothetical protein